MAYGKYFRKLIRSALHPVWIYIALYTELNKANEMSRIIFYAFSYTAVGKSGPSGAAIAQFIGFRCQVSGVRELRC